MSARLYFAPTSVDEALAVIAEHGRSGIVAGGTDAVVGHRSGKRALAEVVVGIHGLHDLTGIREAKDGGVRIGALTTYASILSSATILDHFTALADASAIVGSRATRNVGTLGGNIVNASPAMDTGAPLLVFNATTELRSPENTRQVSIAEMWTGPGESVISNHELLTSVNLPSPSARTGSAYIRLEYRRAMEIAVVGVAVALTLAEDRKVGSASVALAAVGPTCFLVDTAGQAIVGSKLSASSLTAAGEAAANAAQPISDNRASANYRTQMVAVLTQRAIRVAAVRAAGQHITVPASQCWREATTTDGI